MSNPTKTPLPDNTRIIPVPELKNRYAVSEDGTLYKFRNAKLGRHAEPAWVERIVQKGMNGYSYIQVRVDGDLMILQLGAVILITHGFPRPAQSFNACYKDKDRSNTTLSNLEWRSKYGSSKQK